MDSLEFGKKVQVGNYYILKYSKSLSKAEVKRLRSAQNIPADIQKHLQRASLTYIKVSTITDSWSIEFVIGMAMYAFFDTVHYVYDDEGNRLMYGEEKNTIEHILVQMMADTTLIGDKDYRLGKMKLQKEYLEREAAKRNEAEDAGKTEEQLRKESEDAVQEVIDKEEHAKTLLDMGEHLKKGGEDE